MKFTFGDCILDSDARQLTRGGEILPLEPKMYQLLEVLIQRRPGVVKNEELDEILWPNVYVARTSLTRLISELRSVLGDEPRESRIIRTVYKVGYSFCARATGSGPAASSAAVLSLIWNGRQMPLMDGEHIVGRAAECAIVIDDTTVSRQHARITVVSGAATIEDLNSTNGTQVNGTRIAAPTAIFDGNEIAFGSEVVLVRIPNPSAPTVKSMPR
jgi:DNA-binding winged helix-turn-helix (wHTH) protein